MLWKPWTPPRLGGTGRPDPLDIREQCETLPKDLPGAAAMNDLGLEQAVDRLGQCLVMAVADTAHPRVDPRFGEALGAADGQVSLRTAAAIGVME